MTDQVTIGRLQFNRIANDMLQATYRGFQNNVSKIIRRGNENVYQMTRAKYAQDLNQVLTRVASDLIEQCDHKEERLQLQSMLTERIHYFTEEFMRISNED